MGSVTRYRNIHMRDWKTRKYTPVGGRLMKLVAKCLKEGGEVVMKDCAEYSPENDTHYDIDMHWA